jgi:DNA polymerase-1
VKTVCVWGTGPTNAEIMIVGEAPGEVEDEKGIPFVGEAGELLNVLLKEAGLRREEIYITNIVKCRPPENRVPYVSEIKACQKYLDEELAEVNPKLVICMGATSLRRFVDKAVAISSLRGKEFKKEGKWVMPTFHPAYALRVPKVTDTIISDLKRAKNLIEGGPKTVYSLIHEHRIFQSCGEAGDYIERARRAKVLAIDTEYEGEPWQKNFKTTVVGLAFEEDGKCVAFAVPVEGDMHPLKELIESDIQKVGHSIASDFIALQKARIKLNPNTVVIDTMILAHLIDSSTRGALKEIAMKELGVSDWSIDFSTASKEELMAYCAADAAATLYVAKELAKKADASMGRLMREFLIPASIVVEEIENNGILVDKEYLASLRDMYKAKIEELNAKAREYVRKKWGIEDFNPSSSQQVAKILYDMDFLGFTPTVFSPLTNSPSTSEAALVKLPRHEFVDLILELRGYRKLLSTYVEKFLILSEYDGRIHGSFSITGTETGRLASFDPNIQNIPSSSEIRQAFVAPEGWVLIEADLSQIELRLIAAMAQEQRLIDAFNNGEDPHELTARLIFHKQNITKDERKLGKIANFLLAYGGSPSRLWQTLLVSGVTEEEATNALKAMNLIPAGNPLKELAFKIHREFFKAYPNIKKWQVETVNECRRAGGVVRSPIGRRRVLRDINSKDIRKQLHAEREAINTPIQSLASDICLAAALEVRGQINSKWARIVNIVHDMILIEVKEEYVEKVKEIVEKAMTSPSILKNLGWEPPISLGVEIKVSKRWGLAEAD